MWHSYLLTRIAPILVDNDCMLCKLITYHWQADENFLSLVFHPSIFRGFSHYPIEKKKDFNCNPRIITKYKCNTHTKTRIGPTNDR